jgi:hypothetical protein
VLLEGRWFTDQDSETAPRVGIVNENLARELFGSVNPVGKDVLILDGGAAMPAGSVRIVGLARNVKELGHDEVPFADIYLPFAQNPTSSIYVLAKADAAAAPMIRREVGSLDPEEAVFDIKTLEDYVYGTLRGARFNLTLVSLFAGFAVLLASVGIYGAIPRRTGQDPRALHQSDCRTRRFRGSRSELRAAGVEDEAFLFDLFRAAHNLLSQFRFLVRRPVRGYES